MRVVHVAPRFPPAEGGGEQTLYYLSTKQAKMGHEVYVITTDLMTELPRTVNRALPEAEIVEGVTVIRRRSYPTLLPVWGYGSFFLGLKKLIAELAPKIVHTHSYGHNHSDKLARLRKKANWKLVMMSHGFVAGRGIWKYVKDIYDRTIGRKTVCALDAAVAMTESDKKIFEKLGARNVYVIHSGIDLSKFADLPDKNIFKKKYNIKGKMILNVSRLAKVKGHRLLIEAFSKVVKETQDSTLVIIGEDWGELDNLKNLVKSLNLHPFVIFTGKVSEKEILEAYASADIFVLSSIEEPFGLVLLEAMACGVPIISTNRGGPIEVVGNCGLLVNPDPNEIYDAISKLLRNDNLRNAFIECGKKRVFEFTWKKTAEKNIKVYEEILGL